MAVFHIKLLQGSARTHSDTQSAAELTTVSGSHKTATNATMHQVPSCVDLIGAKNCADHTMGGHVDGSPLGCSWLTAGASRL